MILKIIQISSASLDLDKVQGTVLVSVFSLSLSSLIKCSIEGQRYAYQTLKIAIIHTVRNFKLVKCPETTNEEDLTFSLGENGFVGGFKFKVEDLRKEE